MKCPICGNMVCPICGKPMVNAVDRVTGKVSTYLWKTTCEHNKGKIIARG
jgi:anaerobic ribonucleoside-triphosphate reductase